MANMMIDAYANGNVPADNDHMGWARLVTEVCVSHDKLEILLTARRIESLFFTNECFRCSPACSSTRI